MIYNSRSIRVMNKKKSDLWTEEAIENRMTDIETEIAAYITAGYSIVEVAGNADIGVLSGKKIVIWTSVPTGAKSVPLTSISGATSVIYTGVVRTTTGYFYTAHTQPITLNLTSYSDYNNVIFRWGDFTNANSGMLKMNIIDSKWHTLTSTGAFNWTIQSLSNSTIYIGTQSTYGITWSILGAVTLIKNVRFIMDSTYHASPFYISNASGAVTTFQNCIIENFSSVDFKHDTASAGIINYQNCYLKNSKYWNPNATKCNDNSPLFTDTWDFYYSNTNYNIVPFIPGQKIINGLWSMTMSTISTTANYTLTNVGITNIKRTKALSYNSIKSTLFALQFMENRKIADTLKYFDDTDCLVIWRKEFEDGVTGYLTALTGLYIQYGVIYISAGNPLAYRNDESFLIYCTSSSGNTILAWHKGRIMSTFWNDYFPQAQYTIVRCFNILETPDEVSGITNTWGTVANSPLSGSITMRDITSRAVRA